MESSPNDWLKRGWSYLSGVSLSSILRGTVIPAEAEKVGAAITRMSGSPLHLRHVPGLTDVALEADMRFMHRKHGIRLFVVDYIQRVRITQRGYGQNDADALSDFSQKIADQTSRMKATTLILSQLNDEGKIAKSKAMAWDSEIAFTMSRPLKDGQKDSIHGGKVFRGERVENSRELMFHKTRMTGERGNKLLLSFDGDRQRFR
jgi:replicative DNA helicase